MDNQKLGPKSYVLHYVFGQISDFPSSVSSQIAITISLSFENFSFGSSKPYSFVHVHVLIVFDTIYFRRFVTF